MQIWRRKRNNLIIIVLFNRRVAFFFYTSSVSTSENIHILKNLDLFFTFLARLPIMSPRFESNYGRFVCKMISWCYIGLKDTITACDFFFSESACWPYYRLTPIMWVKLTLLFGCVAQSHKSSWPNVWKYYCCSNLPSGQIMCSLTQNVIKAGLK